MISFFTPSLDSMPQSLHTNVKCLFGNIFAGLRRIYRDWFNMCCTLRQHIPIGDWTKLILAVRQLCLKNGSFHFSVLEARENQYGQICICVLITVKKCPLEMKYLKCQALTGPAGSFVLQVREL